MKINTYLMLLAMAYAIYWTQLKEKQFEIDFQMVFNKDIAFKYEKSLYVCTYKHFETNFA